MDSTFLAEFRATLESAPERLLQIPEAETEAPGADGRSAKQVLGHLIDSAANNHARFVCAQLQDELVFQEYDQAGWVRVQKYEQEAWITLVDLWTNYNLHLLHVIGGIPDETLLKPCVMQTSRDAAPQIVTLDLLVREYLTSLKIHLKQLFQTVRTV
ncbi:MAG: DinB family protein [Anaerolineae bacterium]|nr:DinB family protein [Anaerolineae bacterium]